MEITSVLFAPGLGCSAFTVEGINCTRSRRGMTSHSVTAQALGCIHPGTPEMLQLLPEEEKAEEFIAIYTDYPLSTGTEESSGAHSFTGADRVYWGGETWRVVRVRDWQMFGYYQAYAVRLKGEGA